MNLLNHAIVEPLDNGNRLLIKELPPKKHVTVDSVQMELFHKKPHAAPEEMDKWFEETLELINLFWDTHKQPFGISEIRSRCAKEPYDPIHHWGQPLTGKMQRQGFKATGYRKTPKEFNPDARGRVEVLWSL
jgi:hypothetical protein